MFKKTDLLYAVPSIIVATLLVVAVIYAWTEPSTSPPGSNVSAPLNIGTSTQYKSGALGVGGAFHAYSTSIFDGNVGIGTASPASKLAVVGNAPLFNVSGADTTRHNLVIYDSDQGSGLTDWRPYGGLTTASLEIRSAADRGILLVPTTNGASNLIVGGAGIDFYTNATVGTNIGTLGLSIVSGKVGIGTTAPTTTLSVNGTTTVSGNLIVNGQKSSTCTLVNYTYPGTVSCPQYYYTNTIGTPAQSGYIICCKVDNPI
jgi:hypothetical protein